MDISLIDTDDKILNNLNMMKYIYNKYIQDDKYVFSGNNKTIIILEKTKDTKTNEKTIEYYDKNFAMFEANTLTTVLIFNILNPSEILKETMCDKKNNVSYFVTLDAAYYHNIYNTVLSGGCRSYNKYGMLTMTSERLETGKIINKKVWKEDGQQNLNKHVGHYDQDYYHRGHFEKVELLYQLERCLIYNPIYNGLAFSN